jgi:hypothetical protein
LEIVGERMDSEVDFVGLADDESEVAVAEWSGSCLVENGWVLYCLGVISWLGK